MAGSGYAGSRVEQRSMCTATARSLGSFCMDLASCDGGGREAVVRSLATVLNCQ